MPSLRAVGNVAPDRLAELTAAVASHSTLEKVVHWGFEQAPVVLVDDVVVQDEFTHDILVPLPDGLVLVYDAT